MFVKGHYEVECRDYQRPFAAAATRCHAHTQDIMIHDDGDENVRVGEAIWAAENCPSSRSRLFIYMTRRWMWLP